MRKKSKNYYGIFYKDQKNHRGPFENRIYADNERELKNLKETMQYVKKTTKHLPEVRKQIWKKVNIKDLHI